MCNLCNPKRKDVFENGFYSYGCNNCKVPDRVFVVSEKHIGELSPKEYKLFTEFCKKHYPTLKSKHLSESRKTCLHFYELLTK